MELFRPREFERSESRHVGQPDPPSAQGEADVLLRGAEQPRLHGVHDQPPVHPVRLLQHLEGIRAPFHIRGEQWGVQQPLRGCYCPVAS